MRNDLPHILIFDIFFYDISRMKMIGVFENRKKYRMKRSKRHRIFFPHPPDKPLFHFSCGCPRECDDQYPGRIHAMFGDQPAGALGDHRCLSASRPRQYECRSILMFDCLCL